MRFPGRQFTKRHRPAGPRAASVRGRVGGIGRKSSASAEAVSDDLRRGQDAFLDRRRRVAGLTLGGMASLGLVAAYQFGLIRSLPEPPGRVFDADKVDASGEAYQYLKAPDATLGLANAALTLILAGMGAADRRRRARWIPLVLALKLAGDSLFAGYLTVEQVSKHRRLCLWCLVAAATSTSALPQAVPEALAALRGS